MATFLKPPGDARQINPESETDGLALLRQMNREHARQYEGDSRLEARIEAYEMAASKHAKRDSRPMA